MMDDTITTYGLRHRQSGTYVRLEITPNRGGDCCGEYTCEMVYDRRQPRFEVETVNALLASMQDNPHWYNSSKDRPTWGKVRFEECDVVAFSVTRTFDRPFERDYEGAYDVDAVGISSNTIRVVLPERFVGHVHDAKQVSAKLALSTFGPSGAVHEDAWPIVSVVKLDGAELREGMLIEAGHMGRGIVHAVAEVPPTWKIDPGRPFDRKNSDYRVVLHRSDLLRVSGLTDFTVGHDVVVHSDEDGPMVPRMI